MLAFAIDRGDQFRKGHAAPLSDLFQTVPELVFKADPRLVACNDNRALRNQRRHGFSPANEPASRSIFAPSLITSQSCAVIGSPRIEPLQSLGLGHNALQHLIGATFGSPSEARDLVGGP